jgi:TOMM system kinase/cyclase fusion protein
MASNPGTPIPGTMFQGRFDVLAEIGAGSFGRVFKARQVSTGQFVAIKTLRPPADDQEGDDELGTARFKREMELSAVLSHPNIVRLLDSGEIEGGRIFAVFEFVHGVTLRELLERHGPLEAGEAVRLMAQVLDALSCAHAQGVVHRDLKPENVMVTETGARRNALVLDFGLGGFSSTAMFSQARRLTATREMMGTPCYAAPEQLRGEPPSPASDLYSWGLVLLECLTGEIAVGGATAYEVLAEQLSPRPVPIPAWIQREGLGRVLGRVVAKDVEQRESSAAEVLAMLEATSIGRRTTARVSQARAASGERRQLTLLAVRASFAGSDGRPVDLDDLEELLPAHHDRVAALVEQEGGAVLEGTTDRHVAMFGYPVAMENDVRRAVRAGLRLVTVSAEVGAVLARERGLTLSVSAGVHSDLVIIREGAASSGAMAYEIIGRAAEVATRLAAHAAPGEVLASADTAHMLRGAMSLEPALDLVQPDESRPLAVVRIVGEVPTTIVGTAAGAPAGPLIEREAEVEQLRACWRRASEGVPGALLLAGEAGIGKSRLAQELRRGVPAESWIECRCVPETQGSPLQPIVAFLRSLREPLDGLLARYELDRATALPLLASLLGQSLPEGVAPVRLAPDRQHELTIELVVTLLVRMACVRPLVVVVEDLHWSDPTTLEVLRRLVEAVTTAEAATDPVRLLFLATARPSFTPPWSGTQVAVLRLGRLSVKGVGDMVATSLGKQQAADPGLVEAVASRTDGVPLFVEEVLHAIGRQGEAAGQVPATVRELLTARLDALSARARTTVQVAAALGREFSWDLLLAVCDQDEAQLRRDLREVMNAELLHQRRSTAAEHFLFRHALLRDAAYESMTSGTRAKVHRRIATVIESAFPDLAEQQPELLAHHLEAGRAPAEAVTWWQRAGDRGLRHANYQEAARALERALALLGKMPASDERTRREIEALTSLGTVQFSTQGYAAPEVERTFARAQALCVEHAIDVGPKILSGIIGLHITRGDREATQALLPQFRRMAEHPRDEIEAVTGWTTLAIDGFWRGAHPATRGYLDRARPAYRSAAFQHYAREYGYDGGIFSYAYTVWNEWVLGQAGTAESTYRELLGLAEHSFDPYSMPLALCYGMALADWRRDAGVLQARAAELVARAGEQKLYLWLAVGMCGLGTAAVLAGNAGEGVTQIRQGLDLSKTIGDMASYGVYLTDLAAGYEALGAVDEGLAVIEEARALSARSLGCFHEPELLRLEAKLLARRGATAEAERALRHSLEVARANGAIAWELRSAVTLATLLRDAGRADEATALLHTLLAGVPVDVDVTEIEEARVLAGDG